MNRMKSKIVSIFIVLLFANVSAALAVNMQKDSLILQDTLSVDNIDTLQLTLKDALEIALSENLSVKVADKEVTKKEYAKKGSYAALFPQIDFSANYQRTIKKQTFYMGNQSVKVGRDNTWSAGFTGGMPLISVPLWKSLQITGMDVELAVEQAKASKQDLIDQVQQAFYTVLLAHDSYRVYSESYDNALKSYNEVKKRYESGRTSKYDLIRAEVSVQNIEPSVYDAQNSIVLASWRLKALLGIDLNTDIKCIGNLADFQQNVVDMLPDNSLENNSNLKQLDIQQKILDKTYQMQIAKFYPSLNFSISYQWVTMTDNFKFKEFLWNPYSVGGLSLTIPIFSGGQRYNAVRQTKIQKEQLDLQKQDVIRNLEIGVKQIVSSMETNLKQYMAAKKSIEGAQTGFDIAQKRYEIGSGTLLELLDAQLALLQAKLNLNQSIYSYMVSKSSLEKMLGVNQFNKEINK